MDEGCRCLIKPPQNAGSSSGDGSGAVSALAPVAVLRIGNHNPVYAHAR